MILLLKVLTTYGIPFALGFFARGALQRALRARDRRLYAELEAQKRLHLLTTTTTHELLDELSKRKDIIQ